MEVYIEYAFLENFLFDGTLLFLSLRATKTPLCWGKIVISAILGGVFALLFPFLYLPKALLYLLKFLMGALLCLLAANRVKTKKEWGRYALSCSFFFIFTFAFGGTIFVFAEEFQKDSLPFLAVACFFVFLTAISLFFIKKLQEKRKIYPFLYDCEVVLGEKRIFAVGFMDSGNRAIKNGIPVCFLSPTLFYEAFGELILSKCEGHVRDEIKIQTLGGEKNLPLYAGEIAVLTEKERVKKQVYFAPSGNMLCREYSLIIAAEILEGEREKR